MKNAYFLKVMLLILASIGTAFLSNLELMEDGIIRHDVSIDSYVEKGASPEFDCVARYSISQDSPDFAAGVLVSPLWILTAAHFVEDSSVWNIGDQFYKTVKVIKHPDLLNATEEAQWKGRDLALVKLNRPVWNIKPAARYYGKEELGKTITKIGFGFIGDGKEGMRKPAEQIRLGGENVIDAIGGKFEDRFFSTNVMVCDFDSPLSTEMNKFGSAVPLELEIGGSKGDSGGGVFIKINERTELVGIVSGALSRNIKYGSVMSLARISTANKWIDSIIYKNADSN